MAKLLRKGDFDEIYQEAHKFIALKDSIPDAEQSRESHREDLDYLARKLGRVINKNIEEVDNEYEYRY